MKVLHGPKILSPAYKSVAASFRVFSQHRNINNIPSLPYEPGRQPNDTEKLVEMARTKPRTLTTTQADKADRHTLYQDSVQCVEAEIDFVDEVFDALRGRHASILKEDFCGTFNTACEWVNRRPDNIAYGVDLDQPTLDWGVANNLSKLGAKRTRVHLRCDDVLTAETPPCDVILAMNFSYWIFKTRALLRRYMRHAQQSLGADGLLVMDCYGGADAFRVTKDKHKYDGFTYIWDQAAYNPITGDMHCYIHFKFPDGSSLQNAFSYDWRLWTIPELRELLAEAGFSRSTVYWQGEDDDGDGDGVFKATSVGEPDDAWIAYIVAEK